MDNKKSTHPGLSAPERKEARNREAKEAIADHEKDQLALNENRDRLRTERIARETVKGPMFYPAPELPTIRRSTTCDFLRGSARR
jgi:hypothetical protein